jgi:CheY-like chemotaxis protein
MNRRAPVLLIIQNGGESAGVPPAGVRPEESGFLTLRASGASMGYELARARRPDVIALDVDVSGGTGWAVCRLLKRDPATAAIPVIIVNTPRTTETDAHARYVGASAVFPDHAAASAWLAALRDAVARANAA